MDDNAGRELATITPARRRPDPGLHRPACPPISARPSAGPSRPGCSAPPPPIPAGPMSSDLDQFLAARRHRGRRLGAARRHPPRARRRWRDALAADGQTNSTIRRKLTALRSLFSYLKTYGYTGANPAHGEFVAAPAVSRDGKTVGLSPHDCRRLLDAPQVEDLTQGRGQANDPGRHPRPGHARRAGLFRLPRRRAGQAQGARLPHQRRAPRPQHHRQGRQGTDHAAAPGGGRAAGRLAGRARHRRRSGRAPLPRRRNRHAATAGTASGQGR